MRIRPEADQRIAAIVVTLWCFMVVFVAVYEFVWWMTRLFQGD